MSPQEFKKKIEAYTRANIRDVTDQTAQCLMDDLFSNPPSMFPLFFVRRETERTVVQKIVGGDRDVERVRKRSKERFGGWTRGVILKEKQLEKANVICQ